MTASTEIISKLNREERGQLLAENHREEIHRTQDGFKVPSQTTPEKQYTVTVRREWECTCPDHQERDCKCKHIYAVRIKLQSRIDEDGNQKLIKEVTESYSQNWTAYNAAQTNELPMFQNLLSDLTDSIEVEENSGRGRPSKKLDDIVFLSALKVYSGFSLRRFESMMDTAEMKDHINETCGYNTLSRYMNKKEMTPILHELIEKSASPLTTVETEFAVDSSGFSTSTFGKYCRETHEEDKEVRRWIKCHLMCGVTTNVVTGVETTVGNKGDSPRFEPLVEKTAEQFNVEEVSADKAYNARDNYDLLADLGGEAYIPFKSNATGNANGSQAWKKMYHKFQLENREFRNHYNKRNNVETSFHMIKQKFGEDLNSKKERAQINETLLKVLCHNIYVLIHEVHELGISTEF